MEFRDDQLVRYSRQMILDNFGGESQKKLLQSKVLVVGAGGLGSAALLYLGASGVGNIGVVDFDRVDLSNLHRQIIYTTDDINKSKALSAKEKINKLNPDINVISYSEKLTQSNIENIFTNYEIIVDGLDNFNDKFLLNDYAIKLNKKLVHAGVIGFEGQLTTIIPKESACLRCYFSSIPEELNQSCKNVGVLSTCVGVLSTLQANEVIKLILGIGKPLKNRILKFNSLESSFYEFELKTLNSSCSICGFKCPARCSQ